MRWRTQTVMDERARFVIEARNSFLSFSELCRRYGISRPTGYKWLQRYEREGLEGLADRSHRPGSCPHATLPKVVKRILEIRKQRGWGARKLRAVIEREFGYAPSADTVHRILDRHDLLTRRKPKRRRTHPGQPSPDMDRPNATWSADFKGQFRTLDGQLCYPLTIQDGYSRFLLEVKALPRPTLGITPAFIEPGKPQQNGRHERMHRTLKRETARPPRASPAAQQRLFSDFRRLYNDERPHEALGQRTPASLYRPSLRAFPNRRPEISYPDHLEEVGDGLWSVFFGPVHLGWLDERDYRIMDITGRKRRR